MGICFVGKRKFPTFIGEVRFVHMDKIRFLKNNVCLELPPSDSKKPQKLFLIPLHGQSSDLRRCVESLNDLNT